MSSEKAVAFDSVVKARLGISYQPKPDDSHALCPLQIRACRFCQPPNTPARQKAKASPSP